MKHTKKSSTKQPKQSAQQTLEHQQLLDFGTQLKRMRTQLGWSQRELSEHICRQAMEDGAEKCGIGADLISKWERAYQNKAGRIWRPGRDQVRLLITILADNLTPESAQNWARLVGQLFTQSELEIILGSAIMQQNTRTTAGRTTAKNLPAHLPAYHPDGIFGLDELVDKLLERLNDRSGHFMIGITGLGGLGKTTLAAHLAHQSISRRMFNDICWIEIEANSFSVRGSEQAQHRHALTIAKLAEAILLQFDHDFILPKTLDGQLTKLKETLQSKPYLIILDGFDHIRQQTNLLPLLRQTTGPSKFLLTTRDNLNGYSGVTRIPMPELNLGDAQALLEYDLHHNHIFQNLATVDMQQIYQAIGGHPLAIKLIAGQLRFLAVDHVMDNLKYQDSRTVQEFYNFVFRQSWQTLTTEAQKVLLTLTLAAHDAGFDYLAEMTSLNKNQITNTLEALTTRSLIISSGNFKARRYRIHPLTQAFLNALIVQANDTGLNPGTYFHHQKAAGLGYWRKKLDAWSTNVTQVSAEKDNIFKAISLGLADAANWSATLALLLAFAPYAERWGEWAEWQTILSQAIDQSQRIGDTHAELALISQQALTYQRQSQHKIAIRLYRTLLKRSTGGVAPLIQAKAYANLGYLYSLQSHWWRAEVLLQHALDRYQSLENIAGQAHSHNHLGLSAIRLKQWEMARTHLQTALVSWEQLDAPAQQIVVLKNLGYLYLEMGDYQRAFAPLEQALYLCQNIIDQINVGDILLNLGFAHLQAGAYDIAQAFTDRAEAIYKTFANYTGRVTAWCNLGLIAIAQQRWRMADEYLQQALVGAQHLDNKYLELETLLAMTMAAIKPQNWNQAGRYATQLQAVLSQTPALANHQSRLDALWQQIETITD